MRRALAGVFLIVAARGAVAGDDAARSQVTAGGARGQAPASSPAARSGGAGGAGVSGDDAETRRAVRAAVDRGLAYLARRQDALDGSFRFSPGDTSVKNPDPQEHAPFASAAMAALAWLADGNTESRGPYAKHVKRAVDYLLRNAAIERASDRSGSALPEEAYLNASGDSLSRMHGHGYATLALAQVYGMAGSTGGAPREESIRRVLVAAVRKIERSQGETGGWYYTPFVNQDHEGSVTITLVQALRAARNAGIAVDSKVIARAIDYVHRSQAEDGSFRYRIHDSTTPRTPALTAAAVATLNATGDYDSASIDRGVQHLLRSYSERVEYGGSRATDRFPVYERFYAAQALRQFRDPEVFAEWYRRERALLLRTQEKDLKGGVDVDGSWPDRYGRIFATAVNCIVLRIEDSYLPILQR